MLKKILQHRVLMGTALTLGLMALLTVFSGNAGAAGRTYTLDADFDEGILNGVHHDAPTNDQLQLSKKQTTLPFIWVANSGESTVSKIDTVTGDELGRYRTGPGTGFAENPSRTTVDLNGDVWVGNRDSNTAVKIALYVTGDTNGDGFIKTSTDLDNSGLIEPGEVLPWGQDDAILMRISVDSGPRALAVDANNNVWIGGTGGQNMGYYDGQIPGPPLKNIHVGRPCYGALVDGNGTLWISNQTSNSLTRIDNPTGLHVMSFIPANGFVYGIGIDAAGYIYTSGWTSGQLRKYDPVANIWVYQVPVPSNSSRGVAVGLNGDVWVAHSGSNYVTRHDASNGNLKAAPIPVGLTPTGVATDTAGKIWVTNIGSNDIMRIDPATNTVDFTQGTHTYPYNYSDMTGIVSRTITTKIGTWTVDYDSGMAGASWGTISWNNEPQGYEPPGTSISVQARSSNDGSSWSAWETAGNGVLLSSTPAGQYIQVEATLQITSGDVSPILSDLTVEPAVIDVSIDIKPQSCPNPLNVGKNGVLPVAIVGTAIFDPTQVDPTLVKLEGVSPLRWNLEDVATPYELSPERPDAYDCTEEGPDGYLDLTLKFNALEVVAALGEVNDGDVLILTLTGNLKDEFGGIAIQGGDVVRIIKKGKKAPAAPSVTSAHNAYPGPFNPDVWMPYSLGDGVDVSITIYNASGRLIRTLDLGYQNAGAYLSKGKAAHWDGRNEAGEQVSSGIYFYTIQAGDFIATRKIVMVK